MVESHTALRSVQARFADANPELPNGFAEHGSMGAEAMLALGLAPDAVVAWAARHEPVALAADAPVAVLRRALEADLARQPWQEVVRRELADLAPFVGAHLFHGLIRTAHAVRGLRGSGGEGGLAGAAGLDDETGLAELASGLAAWRTWSAAQGPSAGGRPQRRTDPFETVIDAARRGAGACATAPSIVNLHAVTGPMAFLLLADLLDDRTIAAAAAAFEHTHAHHGEPGSSERSVPPPPAALAALLERWDAHPAKLTEAAVRGFALTGDGTFLDAAAAIMGPWPTTMSPGSTPPSSPPGSV